VACLLANVVALALLLRAARHLPRDEAEKVARAAAASAPERT
jgi:hypothetical protein